MQRHSSLFIYGIALPLFLLFLLTFQTHTRTMAEEAHTQLTFAGTLPLQACGQITAVECNALYSLYISTNGSNWQQHDGWLETPRPCSWYGVTCRTGNDGVTYVHTLNLSWNGLQGTLPAELGYLTRLYSLNLSGNEVSGALPTALGALQELTVLNLAENGLVGEVPGALATLHNLTVLHLFENRLAGNLPLEFTALTRLRNFKFQNTQICIPHDAAFEAWLDQIYYLSRPAPSDCRPLAQSPKPLVLLYAVLDNNLTSEWERLVNNAEAGVRAGNFDVKLFIDAKGSNNSYEYTLEEDHYASCPSLIIDDPDCNRYRLRQTLRLQQENTAQRDSLISFVTTAIFEHPQASHIVLALVGHGAGWGANALPTQPKGWTEQAGVISDTVGGMLWDDTGSEAITQTQSLSTRALGSALAQIKALTGHTIDLLYLDACSMAAVEVAYEVSDSVDYLLASANTKWATFPYDQLLPQVAAMSDGRSLGEVWAKQEVAILQSMPGHPYTFALINEQQMAQLATATSALAEALIPLLPTQHLLIREVFTQTSHFDSNYDGMVNYADSYVDLADFARQIETLFSNRAAVVSAAQAVQSAVRAAVVYNVYANDAPLWNNLGGLSIYLPIHQDEAKRRELYQPANLAWAADSAWDEFLTLYWRRAAQAPTAVPLDMCAQTADCPTLTGWGLLPDAPHYDQFVPLLYR